MFASVIICTHNPRPNYLNRTILALRNQTLPTSEWELILVDNASSIPVSRVYDISWHPYGKHITGERLGLAYARIRGIQEASGEILIFVDDDNCLKADYLKIAVNKMESIPLFGAIGSGNIVPEFEKSPSTDVVPFLRSLALQTVNRPKISNELKCNKSIPFGAGLCVRQSIALAYLNSCATNPINTSLGRIGNTLLSGEDIDLALHACRDGYLCGVLPELQLIHLIPKERIEHNYLIKIAAGHAASSYILSQLWNFEEYPEHPLLKWGRYWKNRIKSKGLAKKIIIAEYKAQKDATETWRSLTQDQTKLTKSTL